MINKFMSMGGLRSILYESAVIIIPGILIAGGVVGVLRFSHRPTLEDFQTEYKVGTLKQQVEVAEQYLKRYSPQELNAAVESQYTDGVCHSQAHALGRAVYKKYPNFSEAIKQCGNSCTYGCFHGVLMEMFSTNSDTLGGVIDEETPQQYLAHVQSAAKDLCTKPEVASQVRPRYCYHGIGHVFGYMSGTDLKKAVSSCDIFNENQNIAMSCRSGAFMEYLFSSSSRSILNSKVAAPCDAFPRYTSACYRYKAYGWINVWGGTRQAIHACDTFGANTIKCIRETAEAAASPSLVSTKAGIESICGGLDAEKREACITGALKKVIDLNDGDDSEHACDSVEETFRVTCREVRERYRGNIYMTNGPHIL